MIRRPTRSTLCPYTTLLRSKQSTTTSHAQSSTQSTVNANTDTQSIPIKSSKGPAKSTLTNPKTASTKASKSCKYFCALCGKGYKQHGSYQNHINKLCKKLPKTS
eukprot:1139259_1